MGNINEHSFGYTVMIYQNTLQNHTNKYPRIMAVLFRQFPIASTNKKNNEDKTI